MISCTVPCAQLTLQRILARSSDAFVALSGGLTTALRLALLAGPATLNLTLDPAAAGMAAAAAAGPPVGSRAGTAGAPGGGGGCAELGAGAAAARAALARCGAGALGGDVAELARSLSAVAAVGEAVHGATYAALLADLL